MSTVDQDHISVLVSYYVMHGFNPPTSGFCEWGGLKPCTTSEWLEYEVGCIMFIDYEGRDGVRVSKSVQERC